MLVYHFGTTTWPVNLHFQEILKTELNFISNCCCAVQRFKRPAICILALEKSTNCVKILVFVSYLETLLKGAPPKILKCNISKAMQYCDMKLGTMITIADMKNLLKEEPCRISCLDFRILMTGETFRDIWRK